VTFGGRKISGNMAQAQLIRETNPFFFSFNRKRCNGKLQQKWNGTKKKKGRKRVFP
jgi:hypothetical protein